MLHVKKKAVANPRGSMADNVTWGQLEHDRGGMYVMNSFNSAICLSIFRLFICWFTRICPCIWDVG